MQTPMRQPYLGPVANGHGGRHPAAASYWTVCAGRLSSVVFLIVCLPLRAVAETEPDCDLLVYGGTSAGVIAAVQARQLGKTVLLIEPSQHVGGLTSGGLGATDIGNKAAIGGLAREFYRRVAKHYGQPQAWTFEQQADYSSRKNLRGEDCMWTFEPKVAEKIYRDWLAESGVKVLYGKRLDLTQQCIPRGAGIGALVLEGGESLSARMFIDASYEGDLMARAGVSYHVGREANAQYGETLNGVQHGSRKHQFHVSVDPYVRPGEPASGLLPGIHAGPLAAHGSADRRVQAYCFRMCLTDVPENRLPWTKPEGYDPLRYELLLRTILEGQWDGLGNPIMMPNRKTDTNNNGAFSSDNIGMNYEYPDGDYSVREKIYQEHVRYQQGWLWFLANDPRVPENIRTQVSAWGPAKDEFVDNAGWPHQLYVREARRMVSNCVMTEQHCRGDLLAAEPVGMAAYGMDSHNVQRYVDGGQARNEGDVQVHGFAPYPIAYQSIVPRQRECANLLVPVCLSATHIAYGSIRMEPVFMVLGQSAATAACQAIDEQCAVQEIDTKQLHARLLADGQVLEWTGRRPYRGRNARELPGVIVDDGAAELTGNWVPSHASENFVGTGYLHDDNKAQGQKRARYSTTLPNDGEYEVRVSIPSDGNRAMRVPVTIHAADGPHRLSINERQRPPIERTFLSLGRFKFSAQHPAVVEFATTGANGYVVIDAVQWLPIAAAETSPAAPDEKN